MSKTISSSITFELPSKEERKWGIKGAIEAIDLILSGKETANDLRDKLEKQLKELEKI